MSLGKIRNPWAVIGLSIITLGIYWLYWYYKVNSEVGNHDAQIKVSPTTALLAQLLGFLGLGIPNLISAYNSADRVRRTQLNDGMQAGMNPLLALLLFLFLGIFYPLYVQGELNEHWHWHERQAQAS